jgi:hypothetical protein
LPLLLACGALALHFVALRFVYFPARHPEGFWNLQTQSLAAGGVPR